MKKVIAVLATVGALALGTVSCVSDPREEKRHAAQLRAEFFEQFPPEEQGPREEAEPAEVGDTIPVTGFSHSPWVGALTIVDMWTSKDCSLGETGYGGDLSQVTADPDRTLIHIVGEFVVHPDANNLERVETPKYLTKEGFRQQMGGARYCLSSDDHYSDWFDTVSAGEKALIYHVGEIPTDASYVVIDDYRVELPD